MSRDDERDDLPPDAPATAAETARAQSFARLIDRVVGGESLPPAMDSEDRALVEAATRIVASSRELSLSADRVRSVVDDALERGVLGTAPRPAAPSEVDDDEAGDDAKVTRLPAPRRRRAALPWTVAALATAAAIALLVTRPNAPVATAPTPASAPVAAPLAEELRSRPADPLVGRIPREHRDRASDRLDVVYADRLAGYREVLYRSHAGGAQ